MNLISGVGNVLCVTLYFLNDVLVRVYIVDSLVRVYIADSEVFTCNVWFLVMDCYP